MDDICWVLDGMGSNTVCGLTDWISWVNFNDGDWVEYAGWDFIGWDAIGWDNKKWDDIRWDGF